MLFFLLCIIPHSSSIIPSLLLTACLLSPPDSKVTPPNLRFIMRLSTVIWCAAGASAAPFSYPLASGFPNLNSTILQEVYKLAGSTNLNGSPLFSVPSSMAVYAKALQYSMLILQYLIFGAMLYGTVLHPVCIFPRIWYCSNAERILRYCHVTGGRVNSRKGGGAGKVKMMAQIFSKCSDLLSKLAEKPEYK